VITGFYERIVISFLRLLGFNVMSRVRTTNLRVSQARERYEGVVLDLLSELHIRSDYVVRDPTAIQKQHLRIVRAGSVDPEAQYDSPETAAARLADSSARACFREGVRAGMDLRISLNCPKLGLAANQAVVSSKISHILGMPEWVARRPYQRSNFFWGAFAAAFTPTDLELLTQEALGSCELTHARLQRDADWQVLTARGLVSAGVLPLKSSPSDW